MCFVFCNKQNQRQLLQWVCKYEKNSHNISYGEKNMKNCECPQNSCLLPENPSNLPLLSSINILSWYRIHLFSVGSFSCSQREKNCLVSFCLNFDWFLFQNHPYNLRDAVHQFRLTCEVNMIFFLNKQNCFIANAPSVSRINSTLEFLYQNAHTQCLVYQTL